MTRERICALCGRRQNGIGSLQYMGQLIKHGAQHGVKFKFHDGLYLHLRCANRVRRLVKEATLNGAAVG